MKQVELSANIRQSSGNGPARRLRREGSMPAVLYGPTTPPVMLAVNIRDLEHVVQKGNLRRTIFSLTVQGSQTGAKPVVIKELQAHPVTGRFLHADFYEIDMNRKLRIMVPLAIKGKAAGEEDGGMLQIIEREIEGWTGIQCGECGCEYEQPARYPYRFCAVCGAQFAAEDEVVIELPWLV